MIKQAFRQFRYPTVVDMRVLGLPDPDAAAGAGCDGDRGDAAGTERVMAAKRQVSYQWRLREVMAAAGLFNASDLEPLLAERGITLSSVQVWRLVTQTPERLSLPVLAALCDIFGVTPAQLIATRAENVPARQPVLAVPAPVVADALGFHHTTTTRQHVNAGATWSRYVAGGRADRDPREDHGD